MWDFFFLGGGVGCLNFSLCEFTNFFAIYSVTLVPVCHGYIEEVVPVFVGDLLLVAGGLQGQEHVLLPHEPKQEASVP